MLLLEAGDDYAEIEDLPDEVRYGYASATDITPDISTSDHNWQFTGRATAEAESMLVPRGKVTGGSSAINGQIFLRGVPEDYDNWNSWGNEGWTYEDCLPFFRKLETDTTYSDDFHGTEGPIICHRFQPDTWQDASKAFYQSCLDYGFEDCPDHNNPDSTGVGPLPLNNPNGIRWSTNVGYLGLSRHRLNLTIRPNCMVHRIEFDGNCATGVVVESGGETESDVGPPRESHRRLLRNQRPDISEMESQRTTTTGGSWGNEGWTVRGLPPRSSESWRPTPPTRTTSTAPKAPSSAIRFQPDTWQDASKAFYQSCLDYGFEDCPDHNNPDSTGVGPLPLNNPNGIRWSARTSATSASPATG